MRLTDKEREAINDLPSWPEDIGTGSYRIAMDVLDRLLAREAEYTTLVTPEWLDGAEAKRLKFAKAKYGWWETPCVDGKGDVSVRMEPPCLVVRDQTGHDACFCGVPTIAACRDAVYLATGRR